MMKKVLEECKRINNSLSIIEKLEDDIDDEFYVYNIKFRTDVACGSATLYCCVGEVISSEITSITEVYSSLPIKNIQLIKCAILTALHNRYF